MAKFFGATKLIGGTAGALDDLLHTELTDGDGALVLDAVNNKAYKYTYESSNSTAESSPDIIKPDSNTGDGRWVLLDVYGDDINANSATLDAATISALTLASGASVVEFSTDDTLAGDSDTVVPTEQAVKAYTDALIPVGYFSRPVFVYSDTDTITIKAGMYHHSGTKEQMVYWASDITFDFGSGGSNSGSTDLANTDWFYLYIDDSAVVTAGTRVLTASEFIAVTTAPTWSDTKLGWYNGNDRCIAAFYTNGSAELVEFATYGDTFVYGSVIQDRANADLDEVWEEVTLTIPFFSRKAIVEYQLDDNGEASGARLRMRPKQLTEDGMRYGYTVIANDNALGVTSVLTNANQKIEIVLTTTGAQLVRLATGGYYFGMGI